MPKPGHFIPGKRPYTIVDESGWASGPVWADAENLNSRTLQPVASHYTNYAILAH
jgi:hypothetical protein